jgi:hypothetical protein
MASTYRYRAPTRGPEDSSSASSGKRPRSEKATYALVSPGCGLGFNATAQGPLIPLSVTGGFERVQPGGRFERVRSLLLTVGAGVVADAGAMPATRVVAHSTRRAATEVAHRPTLRWWLPPSARGDRQ